MDFKRLMHISQMMDIVDMAAIQVVGAWKGQSFV
jgi:hypothetical protein